MSQVSPGHIAVDALGLLLTVLVTAASVQDRSGTTPYSDQLDTIRCRLNDLALYHRAPSHLRSVPVTCAGSGTARRRGDE